MSLNNSYSVIFKLRFIIVGLLLISLLGFSIITNPLDNIKLLFYEWMNGGEPLLVNLYINIPDIKADMCGVMVYRYSTPYNPIPHDSRELVWSGRAKPGSVVEVSDYVRNAPPVKYSIDGSIEYRDPQEYRVIIHCYDINGSRASLKASGTTIVEVRPKKPIVDVEVNVSIADPGRFKPSEVEDTVYCDFTFENTCEAVTKLAVINSIEGLEVAFKIINNSVTSAMYLSSFQQDCVDWDLATCECYEWSSWYEAGKKLTPVGVSVESSQRASNGERRVQLGYVEYRLEYSPGGQDGVAGVCYIGPSYSITPLLIRDLSSATYLGEYQPGTPVDPVGPVVGTREIPFGGVYESDEKVGADVSTGISYCYGLGCVTLNVDVYKAGRDDNTYTTPFIVVYDVSGKDYTWYYYWYKDGDPMTYEIEFKEFGDFP